MIFKKNNRQLLEHNSHHLEHNRRFVQELENNIIGKNKSIMYQSLSATVHTHNNNYQSVIEYIMTHTLLILSYQDTLARLKSHKRVYYVYFTCHPKSQHSL